MPAPGGPHTQATGRRRVRSSRRKSRASAASTDPGVETRAPGAREDQPGEQQEEQDLREIKELEQPLPADVSQVPTVAGSSR